MLEEFFFVLGLKKTQQNHHCVDSAVTTTKQSQGYDLLVLQFFLPPKAAISGQGEGGQGHRSEKKKAISRDFQQRLDTLVLDTVYCISEAEHFQRLLEVLAAMHTEVQSCLTTRLQMQSKARLNRKEEREGEEEACHKPSLHKNLYQTQRVLLHPFGMTLKLSCMRVNPTTLQRMR